MAARRGEERRDVPLDKRLSWNIPDLAAMYGMSADRFRKQHVRPAEDGRTAVVELLHGAQVVAERDQGDGQFRVYAHQVRLAIETTNTSF